MDVILRRVRKAGLLVVGILILGLPVSGQEALYLQGVAALEKKQFVQSEELFSHFLQDHPDNFLAMKECGIAQFNQQKYTLAIASFLKADSLEPGVAAFWLAKSYTLSGNTDHALDALQAHLMSRYKKTEKEILLDPVLSKMEKTKGWRALWKKDWYASLEREKAEILFLLSRGKAGNALSKINILLNQYNEDGYLYFYRAQAYKQLGNQKMALEDLQQALRMDPEEPEILQYRAGINEALGRLNEAISDYSRVLTGNPEVFNVYLKRAGVYREQHENDKALQDIKTYLTYFPGDTNAGILGGIISYEAGRYFDALSFFNPLLEQKKGGKEIFVSRGLTYYKLHTYKQAENDFSMALDLDPKDSNVYFNRGKARLALEKNKKACYDFSKAFKMGNRDALEYLQKYCNY